MTYRGKLFTALAISFFLLSPGIAHAGLLGALTDLLKVFAKADETSDAAKVTQTDVVIGGVRLGAAAKKLADECGATFKESKSVCEQRARYFQECQESGLEYSKCRDLYFPNGVGRK